MDGCIYRTKDGECDLYSEGGKYKAFCVIENCKDRKPTNADRIRSMSDEELARMLASGCHETRECPTIFDPIYPYDEVVESCEKCWLNWLNEEVKDETL